MESGNFIIDKITALEMTGVSNDGSTYKIVYQMPDNVEVEHTFRCLGARNSGNIKFHFDSLMVIPYDFDSLTVIPYNGSLAGFDSGEEVDSCIDPVEWFLNEVNHG